MGINDKLLAEENRARVRDAEGENVALRAELARLTTERDEARAEVARLRCALADTTDTLGQCAALIQSACPDASVWVDVLGDQVDRVEAAALAALAEVQEGV